MNHASVKFICYRMIILFNILIRYFAYEITSLTSYFYLLFHLNFSGYIWTEIKQLWDEGAHEYVHDMWNILDFVTNSLYIATLTLRVIAYLQVMYNYC